MLIPTSFYEPCVWFLFLHFTSRSAATDDTILAVNSLLLQFLMFYSYFIDGFAYAGEALTGKYVGASKQLELKKLVRILFVWDGGLTLLFSGVYYFGNHFILKLLTNQHVLFEAAKPFLPWVVDIPIMSTASYIWDGIYIGATASRGMLLSMLDATFVFYALYFALNGMLGSHALWLSMIILWPAGACFKPLLYPNMCLKEFQLPFSFRYYPLAMFGTSRFGLCLNNKKQEHHFWIKFL
ncbi:MAG: hypothetical protein JXR50_12145 [Prolixibacteraceae bacterium]|nr:hypothetical protein [Prolixibacteraceae bacterium]MBN2650483.1 hypothetical protein [Prolixibacteraceae bacterium]